MLLTEEERQQKRAAEATITEVKQREAKAIMAEVLGVGRGGDGQAWAADAIRTHRFVPTSLTSKNPTYAEVSKGTIRALSLLLHPDKHGNTDEAKTAFQNMCNWVQEFGTYTAANMGLPCRKLERMSPGDAASYMQSRGFSSQGQGLGGRQWERCLGTSSAWSSSSPKRPMGYTEGEGTSYRCWHGEPCGRGWEGTSNIRSSAKAGCRTRHLPPRTCWSRRLGEPSGSEPGRRTGR